MKTPKILPWLAGKADVSEERAETLWRDACTQAAAMTGECNTACYWGAALLILRERLDGERWRTRSPLAWPWLLVHESARHGARLADRWLSSLRSPLFLARPHLRPSALPWLLLLWYTLDNREHYK